MFIGSFSLQDLRFIRALSSCPDGATPAALKKLTGASRNSVHVHLHRMCERGMLTAEPMAYRLEDQANGRPAQRYLVSEKGLKMYEETLIQLGLRVDPDWDKLNATNKPPTREPYQMPRVNSIGVDPGTPMF